MEELLVQGITFAIKPHKIKQLQISEQMKHGNKSELIEHVFRKQVTHLACTYTSISKRNVFEKHFTHNNKSFKNFYCCTVHCDICRVHSPTNALLLI